MSSSVPAEPAAPTSAIVTAARPAQLTTACANCSTPLTGKYCRECGQRHHHHPVHDFWHFISEALEDLTHADSRVWQIALAMKPRYRRAPRHYIEHLLFFVHNHAFLFVMLGLSTLIGMITSSRTVLGSVGMAITIYVPIYFYLAMRRVYGQGRLRTLSKLMALAVVYLFLGAVMIAATASYSFLML